MVEYQLTTGYTGNYTSYNKRARSIGNIFSVDTVTGLAFNLSVNGQTMLDTDPLINTLGAGNTIINSGNIFTLSGKVYFNLPVSGKDKVYYDLKEYGSVPFRQEEDNTDLNTNYASEVGAASVGLYNHYLNGYKLISGIHYNDNGGWNWLDSDTTTTGTLFAIQRHSNIIDVTGDYDYAGNYFIKGMSSLYINGKEMPPRAYVELASGLAYSKIASGYASDIFRVNTSETVVL